MKRGSIWTIIIIAQMLIIMQLTPEQRRFIGIWIKEGIPKKVIAITFSCSRVTVWYWSVQDLRTRFNIRNNYKSKITIEAEITILFLRSLGYGCARIKQRLYSAPEIEINKAEIFIQGLVVSRQTVYNVLKKHKLNGYSQKRKKAWKFFRAKYANELWQLDMKEFKFEGKKYYFVVCIDDYSRFLLVLKLLNHCPTTKEIASLLENLGNKPEKILVDNGGQFRDQWRIWCKEQEIEAVFAHPYYPQDKGKIERTNRNISEELVNIIIIFHKLLSNGEIGGWINWFNKKRYSHGVKDYPANLYVKN
jgi:transposase InsO family protein